MKTARVRVSANFERNLDSIQTFMKENEADFAYEVLLDAVFDRLIPNLQQHPRLGRDFMARAPASAEGELLHTRVRKLLAGGELREYILDDYLVLYLLEGADLSLLAIRHHRQLSFDLAKFWGKNA